MVWGNYERKIFFMIGPDISEVARSSVAAQDNAVKVVSDILSTKGASAVKKLTRSQR